MFLQQHGLTSNPFSPDAAERRVEWTAAREVLRGLEAVVDGRIHCLVVSGPVNAGKSSLLRRRLREVQAADVCRRRPELETPEAFLGQLLAELGLGKVTGTLSELRNIVAAYLRHQTGQGRRTYLVVDDIEQLPAPVLEELEGVARLRLKHQPVAHLVLSTCDEASARRVLTQFADDSQMKVIHQRIGGLTLEETRAYVHTALKEAGVPAPDELFPAQCVVDVQAFTRGLLGDINVLCRTLLEVLASRPADVDRPLRVSRVLLKQVGERLGLQYDASAWAPAEGRLSPQAVRRQDPVLGSASARLVVWSGGHQIAEIALDKPRIVLGRDARCDISIDSGYVSRYQNLFLDIGHGWMLFDLNSTNGCYVNGRRAREHFLRDGDLIAVGHHQIRFVCPQGGSEEGPGDDEALDETLTAPSPLVGRSA